MRFIQLLLFYVLSIQSVNASYTWSTENIYKPKYFRTYGTSMLLDNSGNPNILYGGSELFHARSLNDTWTVTSINNAPRVGLYSSAAIDLNGTFHVIHRDSFTMNTIYSTNQSGSWVHQSMGFDTYGSGAGVGQIAVDSNKKVHVVYKAQSGIRYATNITGSWVDSLIGTQNGASSGANHLDRLSIQVDTSNNIHVLFKRRQALANPYELIYANNTSGSWALDVVETGSSSLLNFSHCSLTLDSNDKAHIVYSLAYGAGFYYTSNVSGSWVSQLLSQNPGEVVGHYPSIKLDSNNNIYISYVDIVGFVSTLKIIDNSTGGWMINILNSHTATFDNGILYTNLQIDNQDKLHVSYHELEERNLIYFTNKSGNWVSSIIDKSMDDYSPSYGDTSYEIQSHSFGFSPNITIDSLNNIHVSHIRKHTFGYLSIGSNLDGQIMYSTNATGDFVTDEIIDEKFSPTEDQNNIVIDENGYAHIVYFTVQGEIRYATNDSGVWTYQILESNAYRDGDNDLTDNLKIILDDNGYLHVAYVRDTLGSNGKNEVKYLTNVSGSWVIESVALVADESFGNLSDGSIGFNLDTAGKVHIVYHDKAQNIRYVNNVAGSWVDTELLIRSDFNPWFHFDYKIQKSGVMHLVYASVFCKTLALCYKDGIKYKTNKSGTWETEYVYKISEVNSYFENAIFPKIALDLTQNPIVSFTYKILNTNKFYYNIKYKSLAMSYKTGSIWRSNVIYLGPDLDLYSGKSGYGGDYYTSGVEHSTAVDLNGDIVVSYNDWANGALKLAKSTKSDSPLIDLVVSNSSKNFGNVTIGESSTINVTIKNIGNIDLNISDVNLTTGDLIDFEIGFGSCSVSNPVISKNSECTISLKFTPLTANQKNVSLSINSDDPDYPQLDVQFVGTGENTQDSTEDTGGTEGTESGASAGGGGGGCSYVSSTSRDFDPLFPLWIIISILYFARRRLFG